MKGDALDIKADLEADGIIKVKENCSLNCQAQLQRIQLRQNNARSSTQAICVNEPRKMPCTSFADWLSALPLEDTSISDDQDVSAFADMPSS